jgi:hypothetical protein
MELHALPSGTGVENLLGKLRGVVIGARLVKSDLSGMTVVVILSGELI